LEHHQRWCSSCWPQRRAEAARAGSAAAAERLGDDDARALKGRAVAEGKAAATRGRLLALGVDPETWTELATALSQLRAADIASATGLSLAAAYRVRRGVPPAARHWPVLARLTRLRAQTLDEAAGINAQRSCETDDVGERDVPLSPLNGADIRPMKAGVLRE